MKKRGHSPGNWYVWDEGNQYYDDEIDILREGDSDPLDRTIATVRACREVKANALLIAAAPDLLAACEALRDGWNKNLTEPMRLVNAAIDKAKGETSGQQ